jgi:hypothetical protein
MKQARRRGRKNASARFLHTTLLPPALYIPSSLALSIPDTR